MDWRNRRPELDDTAVDQAIRQALQREVGAERPPDRIWQRISSQITAGPLRRRRLQRVRPWGSYFAPLIQGATAVAILLLLGLSLRSNLWQGVYLLDGREAAQPARLEPSALPAVGSPADLAQTPDPLEDPEDLRALLRIEARTARQEAVLVARQRQEASERALLAGCARLGESCELAAAQVVAEPAPAAAVQKSKPAVAALTLPMQPK